MEVAYGFSRFGRYAHDISDVEGIFGDLSTCDKTAIVKAGDQAKDMIRVSIKAFTERDIQLASKLKTMDDVVDSTYLEFVKKSARNPGGDLRCTVSATLILRYLERIADHATYVGETVLYIVSGERVARK
jgi:phosphate transport system protein